MANYFSLFGVVVVFLFMAVGSDEDSSSSNEEETLIDIDNEKELLNFIQGVWWTEEYSASPNETYKYRIQISGNTMRLKIDVGHHKDKFDNSVKEYSFDFRLSSPERDTNGFMSRRLVFLCDYSIDLDKVTPIWIISDKDYGKTYFKSRVGGLHRNQPNH